jgi:hypothetical protein
VQFNIRNIRLHRLFYLLQFVSAFMHIDYVKDTKVKEKVKEKSVISRGQRTASCPTKYTKD